MKAEMLPSQHISVKNVASCLGPQLIIPLSHFLLDFVFSILALPLFFRQVKIKNYKLVFKKIE